MAAASWSTSSASIVTPDFLTLPRRSAKPRARGFTHVLDKGLPLAVLESLFEVCGGAIDFWKLGWGTAYVAGGVRAKVAACTAAGIRVTPGGTLLEIVVQQGQVDAFVRWLQGLRIDHVEVSNGALGLPAAEKQLLIKRLATDFTVLAEVGSKHADEPVVPARWAEEMQGDLEAGASLLIAEGRESGSVGLFGGDGEVHAELVAAISEAVPVERVIFEAPRKDQQTWLIRELGSDVGLGNIAPEEVLSLETLRLGLRADTVDLLPAPR